MNTVRTFGCIGERLSHSFSAQIHGLIGGYDYCLQELAPDEVAPFLKERKFHGINVTVPYKETVIPYLDEIEDTARRIGAVNTVINRDGKLIGANTDFSGMRAMLRRGGISLRGKKVLILGSGGTAKTATAVARYEDAASILTVSRSKKTGSITYDEARDLHSDAQIILNATPVGMYPDVCAKPIDLSHFPRLCGVADAVYNPLRSELVLEAQRRGIPAVGGLFMLVAQAVEAAGMFCGADVPVARTEEIFRCVLSEKENVVLIGMPGCGKTTVGEILARQLGFSMIDTDARIVEKYGKSIPEIFATEGEEAFRRAESDVIRSVCGQTHCVIATGGGAVLRGENMFHLRKNGRIFFLDRPLQSLIPTADRPTANTDRALRERFEERFSLYRAEADVTVAVTGTPTSVAGAILEKRAELVCG